MASVDLREIINFATSKGNASTIQIISKIKFFQEKIIDMEIFRRLSTRELFRERFWGSKPPFLEIF